MNYCISLILGLSVIALTGCKYDVESELYPNNDCNTPVEVSFNEHVEPLIASSCATPGCHVANEQSPELTSYDLIKASIDDGAFQNRALVQRDMPPSGSLPNCDIQLIEAWIDQGAQNN